MKRFLSTASVLLLLGALVGAVFLVRRSQELRKGAASYEPEPILTSTDGTAVAVGATKVIDLAMDIKTGKLIGFEGNIRVDNGATAKIESWQKIVTGVGNYNASAMFFADDGAMEVGATMTSDGILKVTGVSTQEDFAKLSEGVVYLYRITVRGLADGAAKLYLEKGAKVLMKETTASAEEIVTLTTDKALGLEVGTGVATVADMSNLGVDAMWGSAIAEKNSRWFKAIKGKYLWTFDRDNLKWTGPEDVSQLWVSQGIKKCADGYYPWENGGVNAAWPSTFTGVVRVTNGKWVWVLNESSQTWQGPTLLADEWKAENGMKVAPDGYYPWENGGITAVHSNPADNGDVFVVRGIWQWHYTRSTNSWKDPEDLRTIWLAKGVEKAPDGYYPWEKREAGGQVSNNGISTIWASSAANRTYVNRGMYVWTYQWTNGVGTYTGTGGVTLVNETWTTAQGLRPSTDGIWPWGKGETVAERARPAGVDAVWNNPTNLTIVYAIKGKYLWVWDRSKSKWSGAPEDVSDTWVNRGGITKSPDGYYPWENGGVDAGWESTFTKNIRITNGKWVWTFDATAGKWLKVEALADSWTEAKGMRRAADGYYPWEDGGIDAIYDNPLDLQKIFVIRGNYMWKYNRESDSWEAPTAFVASWKNQELPKLPDGSYPTDKGISAAWTSTFANRTYFNTGKYQFFYDWSAGKFSNAVSTLGVDAFSQAEGILPSTDGIWPWGTDSEVTVTPTVTTTTTPTVTTTTTPTVTPVAEADDAYLKFKVAFAGIDPNGGCLNDWKVQLAVLGGSQKMTYTGVPITRDTSITDKAVFKGELKLAGFKVKSGVAVFIKGPKHLQRKYGENNQVEAYTEAGGQLTLATTAAASTEYNFSGFPMLPGDVAKSGGVGQDGKIDGIDFSFIKNKLGMKDVASNSETFMADLNGNCQIDSADPMLLKISLQEKQEEIY